MPSAKPPSPDFDDEFVRLLTGSQRRLWVFILGMVAHKVDADDLLQEVNLALWKKRHLYDLDRDFVRWAIGFAAMEVKSFRSRSSKNRLWLSDSAIESMAADWSESQSFVDDCRQFLEACLLKLKGDDRVVIEARYQDRCSVKQISSEISKPPTSVYKILQRAHESLRECIKRARLQSNQ